MSTNYQQVLELAQKYAQIEKKTGLDAFLPKIWNLAVTAGLNRATRGVYGFAKELLSDEEVRALTQTGDRTLGRVQEYVNLIHQGDDVRTQLTEIRPRATDAYDDFNSFTQSQGGLYALGPKTARILGHRKACGTALLAALCYHIEGKSDNVEEYVRHAEWHFKQYAGLVREASRDGEIFNSIMGSILATGIKVSPYPSNPPPNPFLAEEKKHIARRSQLITEKDAFADVCLRLRESTSLI